MTLLFTTGNNLFSWLIRKVLNEPMSHFAIAFDLDLGGIVFHSNLLGTHIQYYPDFLKSAEVIESIEVPMTLEKEEELYRAILAKYSHKKYDFKAFAYFTYRALLKRLFGIQVPDKNIWQNADSLLCTGLAEPLRDMGILNPNIDVKDFEMLTPYQIYLMLKDQK